MEPVQVPSVPKAKRKGRKKNVPSQQGPRNGATLDEPIYTTIWRDVSMILNKTYHVLIPTMISRSSMGPQALRDWDLWGPFFFSLLLAILVSIMSGRDSSTTFAATFLLPWVGALLVTANTVLLNGTISFFQAISLLGYCAFPLTLVSLVLCIIKLTWSAGSVAHFILRVVLICVGTLWGTISSAGFFSGVVSPERRALVLYPVFLMYLVLGWIILSNSS